ncbi:hypothetical protein AB0F81_46685, partial [Actinoplanes sp. NPDC024001]
MTEYAELLAAGRWVLAVVFAAALLEVVLPVIPAETILVAAGVVAAGAGRPVPVLVVLVAAAGVCAGGAAGGAARLPGRGAGRRSAGRFRPGLARRDRPDGRCGGRPVRTEVFAHVQRQSLAFFMRTQTGALV